MKSKLAWQASISKHGFIRLRNETGLKNLGLVVGDGTGRFRCSDVRRIPPRARHRRPGPARKSWLRKLKAEGYQTHVEFLSLTSSDLAVARVAARVREGGHDVPEEVIRRRFTFGLVNFFSLYQPVVDSWQLVDNTDLAGPRMIALKRPGGMLEVHDEDSWHHLMELAR